MTARTVVSHAAVFLLGLMVAGGVGLWAVWQEQERTRVVMQALLEKESSAREQREKKAKESRALKQKELREALRQEALVFDRLAVIREKAGQAEEAARLRKPAEVRRRRLGE